MIHLAMPENWMLETVKGKLVDKATRCVHYKSALDIIAIRFKCCNEYYACYYCHQECADHEATQWSESEFSTKAILCGNCAGEISISEYMNGGYSCLYCQAPFNPNCKKHNHLYFSG